MTPVPLRGQVVEFQAEIDFASGDGNTIRGVHRDAVDKSKSQSLEMSQVFGGEVDLGDLRYVENPARRCCHHSLVGLLSLPITGESLKPKTESAKAIFGPKVFAAASELSTKEVKFCEASMAVLVAP
jgi:hypothetical protein